MTVVVGHSQPLHREYRNSDRPSRCLSEPVTCVLSSLRYRSTPGSPAQLGQREAQQMGVGAALQVGLDQPHRMRHPGPVRRVGTVHVGAPTGSDPARSP